MRVRLQVEKATGDVIDVDVLQRSDGHVRLEVGTGGHEYRLHRRQGVVVAMIASRSVRVVLLQAKRQRANDWQEGNVFLLGRTPCQSHAG